MAAEKPWAKILVAVRDPGERKQIAIRKAARIASASGAAITLFHAFSRPQRSASEMALDPEVILRKVAKLRRDELLKLARSLRTAGLKVACEVVWDFPPAHAIVRQVLKSKPDLVVAESHRHSRVARWFLANSDWDLIRECPCPVWFVKQERFARKPLILTAIDPTHAHAKPSGLDEALLRSATAVTRLVGGRIAMIHVDPRGPRQLLNLRPTGKYPEQDVVPPKTMAAIERLGKRHGVAADACVVASGTPADVLTATTAEMKADLLVMGAISRSGLSHFHIGNTAEAVIDAVNCDVLIVKPRQFKTAVPRKPAHLPA